MKLVLSRKGSDSRYGKRASVISGGGGMVSIPIPEEGFDHAIDYRAIQDMPSGLTGAAHLDPDLRYNAIPRSPGWRPSFGHCDAALTHLINQGVGIGDLIVFFGWFKGPGLPTGGSHVAWGWLQIGNVYWPDKESVPSWLAYHPHACPHRKPHGSNAIFTASERLAVHGVDGLPGAGTFDIFHQGLQLSEGDVMSRWRVPAALIPPDDATQTLSRHRRKDFTDLGDGTALLQTKSPGQEYVIDCDRHPDVLRWIVEKLWN